MNINELLEKYYAGETSSDEEIILRNHFANHTISEEWKDTATLFSYFEEESKVISLLDEIREDENLAHRKRRRIINSITTVAASIILAIASIQIKNFNNRNYVFVDGTKITNPEIIQQQIENAFENVKSDNSILEQQLQFMFE